MPIQDAFLGEDVPLTVEYTDPDTGDAVDPDDTDADGTPDASVTISKFDEDIAPTVDGAAMTHTAVGTFEYVWDSGVDEDGTGRYVVETSAEFGGETDIERDRIRLR